MKVTRSSNLEKIIFQKYALNMRDLVKKNCMQLTRSSKARVSGMIEGLQVAASHLATDVGPDFVVACVNGDMILFDGKAKSEKEWCEFVATIEKQEAPLPRVVLVKMLALRLKKLYSIGVQEWNKLAYQRNNPGAVVKLPDFTSGKLVPDLREKCKSVRAHTLVNMLDDIQSVLIKVGMDDSIVAEAWNYQQAREVMES